MSDERTVHEVPASGSLDPEIVVLEQRLNDGHQRIERARGLGQDVRDWESFWLDLLCQYEQAMEYLPTPDEQLVQLIAKTIQRSISGKSDGWANWEVTAFQVIEALRESGKLEVD